jgi:hypothetical protein
MPIRSATGAPGVRHRAQCLVPGIERRRPRDHAGEVDLALERPLREPWEILLRQMVAAVRDEDPRAPSEEPRQVDLGFLAGR